MLLLPHSICWGSGCRRAAASLCCSFSLSCAMTRSLRHHGTHALSPYSEDRVANWCRRLWSLGECSSMGDVRPAAPHSNDKSQVIPLLDELQSQAKLAEELKAALIGGKGQLPGYAVESVWNIYESIIPPALPRNIACCMTPAQVTGFFDFIGLITELDVNLSDVRAAAANLNRSLDNIEALLTDVQRSEVVPVREGDCSGIGNHGIAALSMKLVAAKSELLQQCFAVRQAGSPVYYLWLRQTASLKCGMRRLMELRRCLTFFQGMCHERISALNAVQQGQPSPVSSLQPTEKVNEREEIELWVARQRHVSSLDAALHFLFTDFFAKEWLVMEELTWCSTPPLLLEKVIDAEKVHPFVGGIVDMKRRLRPAMNRHLFAFFHPSVVEEPLIAVQVALTRGIAESIDHILGRPSPLCNLQQGEDQGQEHSCSGVDTAMFYSINSVQPALRGVNLGNPLIKRVVQEIEAKLNAERCAAGLLPITTFSTLSPIPGYIPWLAAEVGKLQQSVFAREKDPSAAVSKFARHRIFGTDAGDETQLFSLLHAAVLAFVERTKGIDAEAVAQLRRHPSSATGDAVNMSTMQFLLSLFMSPGDGGDTVFDKNGNNCSGDDKVMRCLPWWEDREFTCAIELPLLRSVAHYLYKEKKRNQILDPVGNFHVSNGATMLRLNFLANCTAAGSRESATVMVNYLYDPSLVTERVNAYELHHTVSVGDNILQCLAANP